MQKASLVTLGTERLITWYPTRRKTWNRNINALRPLQVSIIYNCKQDKKYRTFVTKNSDVYDNNNFQAITKKSWGELRKIHSLRKRFSFQDFEKLDQILTKMSLQKQAADLKQFCTNFNLCCWQVYNLTKWVKIEVVFSFVVTLIFSGLFHDLVCFCIRL